MEITTKKQILENIGKVYEKAKGCRLKESFLDCAKIRSEIWKLKLPQLSENEYQVLAEKFSFSGGQIDNIIRKSEIQEVVLGEPSNFKNIELFCREEFINNSVSEIGFNKKLN